MLHLEDVLGLPDIMAPMDWLYDAVTTEEIVTVTAEELERSMMFLALRDLPQGWRTCNEGGKGYAVTACVSKPP